MQCTSRFNKYYYVQKHKTACTDNVKTARTAVFLFTTLKEIQYYYAHEKEFARADRIVGQSNVREKAVRYNAAVRTAPPVLYDLYVSLYVYYNAQAVAAEDMDYSVSHIKRLNRRLCEFLATALNRGDDKVGSV